MRSVIIIGRTTSWLFPRDTQTRRGGPVQCRERLGGLLRYDHQEAARPGAEKSPMILWRIGRLHVCKDKLCRWRTTRCHRTLLARSTGKATKGWSTINALEFLESEPRINIFTMHSEAALLGLNTQKRPGFAPGLHNPSSGADARSLLQRFAIADRCRSRYSRKRHSPRCRKHRSPCCKPRPSSQLHCCRGSAHRPRP
jgi:hypothetical protein